MASTTALLVLWNAAGTLDECLTALRRSVPPIRIICVDNASEDESVAIASRGGATVVEAGTNLGFPRAVNTALPLVDTDFILLLNPDVTVEPDTIERCRSALESDPGVGVVGANLTRPDGFPDPPAARRFRTLPYLAIETLGLPRLSPRLDRQYLSSEDRAADRDVEAVNGAFLLLRSQLLRELGGLDETVFLFLEDQDLCRRVRQRGLRVRFVAGARARHVGGAATRAASPERRAVVYLHRMDASIELVRRLQGPAARAAAVGLWTLRCSAGLATRGAVSADERRRYAHALRWLVQQVPRRTPPPAVT